MNAKEKAKELVAKFYFDLPQWVNTEDAKICAIIAVDEILNIDNIKPYILHKEIIEFYQEVKQEIQAL